MAPTSSFLLFLLSAALEAVVMAAGISPETYSGDQQPLDPGSFAPNTVPAFPLVQADNRTSCRLDLSDELFGGVGEACGRGVLDRSRCCPVLAAWLFAAHARSALDLSHSPPPVSSPLSSDDEPMMPDDNQRCVDSLQSALEKKDITLARPNASCDAVLCFCGIRLHQIGSLSCPAAFSVNASHLNATPTAAVRGLEHSCRNASYAGCTQCLHSLEQVKGHTGGSSDRAARMFGRDCQLMGLTWLLAKNKTLYIPTVSAVLRAVLYSAHLPPANGSGRCSPDQENMPLAVDSLQFQRLDDSAAAATPSHRPPALAFSRFSLPLLLLALFAGPPLLG